MSLVVNHNLMAANVARNLNAHYANLSNSTQRLSTGLRVNSAADDAAGLAIRELQRADIAALHQGSRNANDAISLIQVADGALSIIDEKLIRMKELAEQAATGTYDSTQRMMIESEYQAMASEITRIANATDFNGMKLLDGTLSSDTHNGSKLDSEGKMKIHFGTGNESAEDYYYIQIEESTSQAFGVGDASTWEDASNRIVKEFSGSLEKQIATWAEDGTYTNEDLDAIKDKAKTWAQNLKDQLAEYTSFSNAAELEALYNKFKSDEEVAGLSDLFKESIANFDSVTYREQNKMQYALGHAAMRQANLFEFDNYTPINDVYSSVASAFKTISGKSLITGEADVTGDIELAAAASTAAGDGNATGDIFNANEVQTAVRAARPSGEYIIKAVEIANNSSVKNSIDAQLKNGQTSDFIVTYNDNGTAYAITCNQSGGIKSIVNTTGSPTLTATCNGELSGSFTTAHITTVTDGTNTYAVTSNGSSLSLKKDNYTYNLNSSTGYIETVKDGSSNIYTVNSNHTDSNVVSMQDTNNNILRFSGNGTINPANTLSMTDGFGNLFTFEGGKFVSMKDSSGNSLVFDGNPELGSSTAPAATNLLSFTDASGNVFKITGGAITEVQYGSKTYTLNFDLTKNPTDTTFPPKTITETNGNKYTFNDAGLLSSAKDSLDNDILSVTLAEDDLLEGVFADAAAEAEKRNYAGFTVATQEDAQNSLVAISDAIEAKDKIRARLGALQNRLENTISNLNIQAENLQAAESRISDVDVSTEMTEFVRQQILTQSAVAMLSQANSLPQMAMQLIGG